MKRWEKEKGRRCRGGDVGEKATFVGLKLWGKLQWNAICFNIDKFIYSKEAQMR